MPFMFSLVNKIYLNRHIEDVEHLANDKSRPVQRVPLLVVVEVLSNGRAVLGSHVLRGGGGHDPWSVR